MHRVVDRVVAARLPAIVDAEVRRALDERLPVLREETAALVA